MDKKINNITRLYLVEDEPYSDCQEISDIINNLINTYGEDTLVETMKLFGFSLIRDQKIWNTDNHK